MKHVHFIGIGGAGTSGLAELLLARGVCVSGSDAMLSNKTEELSRLGATIYEGHRGENIASDVDTVVYSSAIKGARNAEFEEAERRNIRSVRRAEFMSELLLDSKIIAVAGTHGKTTTTSMIAQMLIEAKLDPIVLVGATVKELGDKNARAGKGKLAVVEADEYDRSFLTLRPYVAVITSLEAEHLDIYKDLADLEMTFAQFANQGDVGAHGFAVACIDEPHVRALTPRLEKRIVSYGVASGDAKYRACNIIYDGRKTKAAIMRGSDSIGELELHVPGEHNLKNALAAIAVGEILSIPFEITRKALKKFVGAERRFQLKGEANGVLVIDDYAHHPTEIRATLNTVRHSYPNRRIIACFQPHTYTRTRDFAIEFGNAFAELADVLLLLPIYAAREQPISGVASELILEQALTSGLVIGSIVPRLEMLPDAVCEIVRPGDVVLTIGAGTITEAAPKILDAISQSPERV